MQTDSIHENKVISNIEPFNEIYFDCYKSALFAIINSFSGTVISYLLNDIFYYNYSNDEETPIICLNTECIFSTEQIMNDLGIEASSKIKTDDI